MSNSEDSSRPLLDLALLAHPAVAAYNHLVPLLALTRVLRELLQGIGIYFQANPRLACTCSSLLPAEDLLRDVHAHLIFVRDRGGQLPTSDLVMIGGYLNAVHRRIRDVLRIHFTLELP